MPLCLINESLNSLFSGIADLLAIIAVALLIIWIVTIIIASAKTRSLKRKLSAVSEENEKLKTKLETMKRYALETQYAASSSENSFSDADEHSEPAPAPEPENVPQSEPRTEPQATPQPEPAQKPEPEPAQKLEPEKSEEKIKAEEKEPPQSEDEDDDTSVIVEDDESERKARQAALKDPWGKTEQAPRYVVKFDRTAKDWVIIKTGNTRATRRVKTKAEALAIAKELSKNSDTSLVVHKRDGKFQKQ